MRRIGALLVAALVVLVPTGCATEEDGDDGAGGLDVLGDIPAPLAEELTHSGRCDDGRLWAADRSGSLAVAVDPGADGMPAEARLPSDAVAVTVLRGDDIVSTICDEAVDQGSPAEAGRLEVDRPMQECGPTSFRIYGLEAEDGTSFGAIEGHDDADGCVSG